MEDTPGNYISIIRPTHVLSKLIDNLGVEKGNEVYQSWTSSPNELKDFMENLDKFNERRL